MLVAAHAIKTSSVERLIKLWSKRYEPDLSPSLLPGSAYSSLIEAASLAERAKTAARLNGLINVRCELAGIQTNTLYAYLPNVVNLAEARRLTEYAFRVYQKLVEIYRDHSPTSVPQTAALLAASVDSSRDSSGWRMPGIDLPPIEKLAKAIEPVLLEYQEQHKRSRDWRTLGFITTQFNFCNQLLLQKLTSPEQVLLKPYFKFIEEQVAHPWERVCAAAASYSVDSPVFKLVEEMLPLASEIAQTVYPQLTQVLPQHRSRRGRLDDPGITHSCLRDLSMFQAYLWLCVLEGSVATVEKELVTLCVMVLPSVEVKWEMTQKWNQLLMDEILRRVTPEQKRFLLPYTEGFQEAFLKERGRFEIQKS